MAQIRKRRVSPFSAISWLILGKVWVGFFYALDFGAICEFLDLLFDRNCSIRIVYGRLKSFEFKIF